MSILKQIDQDYITAMKARDTATVDMLRMMKAALKNEAIKIEGMHYELSDQEVLAVLAREVKQRNDAVAQYESAGRPELAAKEKAEIVIINRYLPEALSDEDLAELVKQTIAEVGATTKADTGKVMGALKAKLANPADTGRAAKLVGEQLQ